MQLFWDSGIIGLYLIGLQAVLTLVFGHDGDMNVDGDGFLWSNHLSLKTIAAMLLGIDFGGATFSQCEFPIVLATLGGIAIGIVLSFFFVALMRDFYQMRSDGTAQHWEAIGQRAKVSLAKKFIPCPEAFR